MITSGPVTRSDLRTAIPVTADHGGVVVGYDGTWRSRPALDRAAVEAVSRGTSLTVLSVVPTTDEPSAAGWEHDAVVRARWERAARNAMTAVQEIRAAQPEPAVSLLVALDGDLERLHGPLSRAELLVLGDVTDSGPRAFLLGSVSRDLLRSTLCPVLVVPVSDRGERLPAPPGPPELAQLPAGAVVVGVRNGPEVLGLLRVAAAEAARRGAPLCVLHSRATGAAVGADEERAARKVQAWCEATEVGPSVSVARVITACPPAEALLRAADRADLLVVGSRGPLALARLAIESVSRRVLDRAAMPVLLVPHTICTARSS